jgi:hypothetical protein
MKRILILLIAAGLVCAFPATALAGKPDKPAPATVDVTITGHIDTTIDCSTGPITMDYSDQGNKHSVVVGDQDWVGNWIDLDLVGLEPGCYSAYHEDNEDPEGFAGMFGLHEQSDGTVELVTQFDRLWRETGVKKGQPVFTLEEAYLLRGDLTPIDGPFSWDLDEGGGTLTGNLDLYSFTGRGWLLESTTSVTIEVGW